MNTQYKIESGIPFPGNKRTVRSKYPWRFMKVGQSFFVPNGNMNTIASHVWNVNKQLAPAKFKCRKVVEKQIEGLRVWRVE